MFRAATERAGIRLDVDGETIGVWALVDREMWAKIVSNLLSNALKFTFEGSITVSVRQFLAEDSSAWVELRVSDTGIGISEDDQSHLFERFYRVEGVSSRSFEGSGIGLALVAELVNLHGGHIEASSVPGQGSTFSVQLPAREGEPWRPDAPVSAVAEVAAIEDITSGFVAEAMRWLANAEERESEGHGGEAAPEPDVTVKPRILVADDNGDMRRYISSLLGHSYHLDMARRRGRRPFHGAIGSPRPCPHRCNDAQPRRLRASVSASFRPFAGHRASHHAFRPGRRGGGRPGTGSGC